MVGTVIDSMYLTSTTCTVQIYLNIVVRTSVVVAIVGLPVTVFESFIIFETQLREVKL